MCIDNGQYMGEEQDCGAQSYGLHFGRDGQMTVGIFVSCNQAALRTVISVCLSVCLSLTPFGQCFSHRIITKFSGVITNDRSDVHAKGQGQRSKGQGYRGYEPI